MSRTDSNARPVRYDIVGCGSVLQNIHLPVLSKLFADQKIVVGICYDTNLFQAQRLAAHFKADFSDDVSQLKRSDCDLVLIATPVNSHFQLAMDSLNSGKDLFIEKPFVTSCKEAEKLNEAARTNQRKISVGHIRRFYPTLQAARKYIASGALGKIRRVEATEGGRWSWGTASGYLTSNIYGGVLFETGSHLLDTVLYILSLDGAESKWDHEIRSVTNTPNDDRPSNEINAEVSLRIENKEAIDLSIRISRVQALPGMVRVYGEKAILIVPNGYPSSLALVSGKEVFELSDPFINEIPLDFTSCILQEHLEVIKSHTVRDHFGSIDSSNFIHLSGMLESLLMFNKKA